MRAWAHGWAPGSCLYASSRSGRVRYHAAPIPIPTPRNSRKSRGKSRAPCRGALPPSQVVSRESRTKCHCRAPTPYWLPYQKGGKSSRTSARLSPARTHRAVLDSRVFIWPLARDRMRSGQSLGRTSRGTTSDKGQYVTPAPALCWAFRVFPHHP
jgi:hypothetical protein